MAELTIKATVDNLEKLLTFVDAELEQLDCSMKAQMQIDLAVEELFVNIARYAYAPDEVDGCIYIASMRELKLGERVNVKVLDCDEYTLTGEEYED